MKKIFNKILICLMTVLTVLGLSSCKATLVPSVVFGFKTVDGAGEYNESIDAFEVGKVFYTCIKIKLVTDKQKQKPYVVVVELPKTSDVTCDQTGGLRPTSSEWDAAAQKTVLSFVIYGSKEASEQKILFKGTPVAEGNAVLSLDIYDEKGVEECSGFFRTIFFKYELQQ